MKSTDEIQKAHDILHAVIEYDKEQEERMPKDLFMAIHSAHDVLSWVLEGTCQSPFADNLKMLNKKMERAGFHLVKRESPPTDENHP